MNQSVRYLVSVNCILHNWVLRKAIKFLILVKDREDSQNDSVIVIFRSALPFNKLIKIKFTVVLIRSCLIEKKGRCQ